MKTDLTLIPGVGKKTKQALQNIGINYIEDLKGQNPEELYLKDSLKKVLLKTNASYTYLEWLFIMLRIKN